jgi:acetyl esterase/lipase
MIGEDDEFESYEEEGESALDRIRVALIAEKEAGAPFDLAAERLRADQRGANAPMPDGWTATPYDLGRPAWLLSGPGARESRTILHLFGGGYCIGSLRSRGGLAAQIAKAAEARSFLLDYRLAPEHPFPAAFEDAYEAYRRLLGQGCAPESLVLLGESAGGGLALAVAARARADGLPMPLAIVAIAPWTDLTQSGDSMTYRAAQDPSLTKERLDAHAARYLAGADLRDPRASPLFADLAGLPQLLIHVGGDEVLLSDSERFVEAARAVGVDATVEIWPGLFHVWHRYYAEMEEAREGVSEIGAWLKRRWKT